VTGDWFLLISLSRSDHPIAFISFPVESHPALIAKKSSAEIRPRSLLRSIKYRVSSSSPRAICKGPENFLCGASSKSFRDIRRNGRTGTSDLRNDSKLIASGKLLRHRKNQQRKFMRFLPNLQLAIILEFHESPVTNHESLHYAP